MKEIGSIEDRTWKKQLKGNDDALEATLDDAQTTDEVGKLLTAAKNIFDRVSNEMKSKLYNLDKLTDWFGSEEYLASMKTYFVFLRKAVELRPNHPEALEKLAEAYLDGYGTRKSRPEALRLIRRAADCGTPDQLYDMSWKIKHEVAGKRSWPEGMREIERMCRLAAVQGHEGCQFLLGEMYAEGLCGLSQSYALAKYWLEKAAENGEFPPAEHFLKNFRDKPLKKAERLRA